MKRMSQYLYKILFASKNWLFTIFASFASFLIPIQPLIIVTSLIALLDWWVKLYCIYKSQGIDRIVALRGDLPSGQVGLGELPYAQDLVRFIREHSGNHFHIEVAAYPEMHPQADSFDADIKRFVEKVNAGANAGITQFFFNPDAYFYFIERLEKEGINIPVAPGIMPITNASNLIRFADGTGAEIPRWIRKQLAAYGDDSESIKAFGHEVIVKLCERLIAGGAPTLHFYSMNQTEPTRQLVVDLGLN